MPTTRARRAHRRTALLLAAATLAAATTLVASVGGTPLPAAAAATSGPGDGASSVTAGASCWGIKRSYPSKGSGTYWLLTPAMARPAPFYCDMTTDGGGWVLVGRGREGWTWDPTGQQTPEAVRTAVSGPAAFAPAALDSTTINELIGGAKVSALSDGIRVQRARNAAGTVWQDYRWFGRWAGWTWTFDGGQLLSRSVIDGVAYAGGNTNDSYPTAAPGMTTNKLAGVQGIRRLFTSEWANNDRVQGFTYGRSVPGGTSSSTNHLYQRHSNGYPMPFTRVWLRPRIANPPTGYAAIPAGGFAAQAKPYTLKNRSELAPWGVVGLDHTNEEPAIEPWNTAVLSVRAGNGRVFVGGRFTGVRQGPTGAITTQRSLAAFDLDGTWISTFRPSFNGRVWDMVLTSDGKLIVAGDFTAVNGLPDTAGLVALNPTTGAVITTWKANVSRTGATGTQKMRVRALDVRGGWVYAAGNFNNVKGGTATTGLAVTNAISVSAANGTPGTWRPRPGAGVYDIQVVDAGDRVLLAGNFGDINGDTNMRRFGITDIATGNPSAGIGPWSTSIGSLGKDFQLSVGSLADGRVLVGGSQHSTQLWNRNRTTLLDSAITKVGGDTQVIEAFGSVAFIGCHCGNWIWQGANNYTKPANFRSIDPINLVGMWNTSTWQMDTSWYPGSLKGGGEGVWSVDKDSRGCFWFGGDLTRGAYSGDPAKDYLGGFARFCAADTTPPTAPTNLQITSTGSSRKLTWAGSTDAVGPVTYDIYRNDRVIATVNGFTYTDPNGPSGSKYTVRAADARGNRSSSPAPKSV